MQMAATHGRLLARTSKRGQQVQLFIPGNTFHTAHIAGQRRWFLGASTEWPGVTPADVEIGNLDALAAQYPAVAADLRAIATGSIASLLSVILASHSRSALLLPRLRGRGGEGVNLLESIRAPSPNPPPQAGEGTHRVRGAAGRT